WAGGTTGLYILRTIYCATGAPAYNTWSENTTTKTAAKLRHEVRQTSCIATFSGARTLLESVRALRYQCESRGRGPHRTLHVFNQPAKAITFGITDAHRRIENLFGNLYHPVQQCTAAGEHHAT